MHTVVGFQLSAAGTLTYSALTAAFDQAVTISANNRFLFPWAAKILGAFVIGVGLTGARHDSASLRGFVLPEIYPGNVSATVPDNYGYADYEDLGPTIPPTEEYAITISHTGAGPDIVTGHAWVTDRFTPAPGGQTFTLVGTATPTLILGQWVAGQITFNQTLPTGTYVVTGMANIGVGTSAARLIFPGDNRYRPGCISVPTYGFANDSLPFRSGRNGLYGRFINTAQPAVEWFGLVAGANAQTVMLDVIKVG